MPRKKEQQLSVEEIEITRQVLTQLHDFTVFMDKFKEPLRKQYATLPSEESDGTFLSKLKVAFFELCKVVYVIKETMGKSTEVITRLKREDLFLMPF